MISPRELWRVGQTHTHTHSFTHAFLLALKREEGRERETERQREEMGAQCCAKSKRFFFEITSHRVDQAGSKLAILLPQPPQCWFYKHPSPAPVQLFTSDKQLVGVRTNPPLDCRVSTSHRCL